MKRWIAYLRQIGRPPPLLSELFFQPEDEPDPNTESAREAVPPLVFVRAPWLDQPPVETDRPSPEVLFHHTRDDGPFDPCPICLPLMSKEQLLALVKDRAQKAVSDYVLMSRLVAALEQAMLRWTTTSDAGDRANHINSRGALIDGLDRMGRK